MARILSLITMVALCCSFTACGFLPFGGGASAYKPTEVLDSAFMGDLADAKPGKSVTYGMAGDTKITVKVVGKEGDLVLIENWTESPSMTFGVLYKVGSDKKVKEAYAAAKDDKEWTKITVKETPKPQGGAQGEKPEIKESDEKKEVKAGNFSSHRVDTKGSNYSMTAWYSKDVPKLYSFSPEHGGLVATEVAGSKTTLEAKADDAKASALEMPKK
ncbi:MAG TPA: hypothetical protein VNM14_07620 [Planctomycetota bacterium]|nr:hypothetical protein [Planctomycetota bacterium]